MNKKQKAEIQESAEKLVGSFMKIKTPAYKRVLKEAIQLFNEGQITSGKIRKKLIHNRILIK